MPLWTAESELSGRKAFDLWRFTESAVPVSWDWADMGDQEKARWIERAARGPATRRPATGRSAVSQLVHRPAV